MWLQSHENKEQEGGWQKKGEAWQCQMLRDQRTSELRTDSWVSLVQLVFIWQMRTDCAGMRRGWLVTDRKERTGVVTEEDK